MFHCHVSDPQPHQVLSPLNHTHLGSIGICLNSKGLQSPVFMPSLGGISTVKPFLTPQGTKVLCYFAHPFCITFITFYPLSGNYKTKSLATYSSHSNSLLASSLHRALQQKTLDKRVLDLFSLLQSCLHIPIVHYSYVSQHSHRLLSDPLCLFKSYLLFKAHLLLNLCMEPQRTKSCHLNLLFF